MNKREIVFAPALPPTNESFVLQTKPLSLNDIVKSAIMNGAYERLHPYLQTVDTKDKRVMGSLMMDRAMAAVELKKWGVDTGSALVIKANLAELDHAIHIALRSIRDGNGQRIDRKSRRLAAISAPRSLPSSDDLASSGE